MNRRNHESPIMRAIPLLNYDFSGYSRALTGLRAAFARVAGTPDCRYSACHSRVLIQQHAVYSLLCSRIQFEYYRVHLSQDSYTMLRTFSTAHQLLESVRPKDSGRDRNRIQQDGSISNHSSDPDTSPKLSPYRQVGVVVVVVVVAIQTISRFVPPIPLLNSFFFSFLFFHSIRSAPPRGPRERQEDSQKTAVSVNPKEQADGNNLKPFSSPPFPFLFLFSFFFSSFSPILQLRSLAVLLVSSSLLRCFSAVNCPLKFPLLLIDGARSCFLHSEI